jgi:eukaryotic-like serine/threonine-protein kinase
LGDSSADSVQVNARPERRSSRDDPADLEAGTVIADKYVLKAPLGKGGMGWVYLAEQQPVGRPVAMKLLRAEVAERSDTSERFFREALALSQIQHPNVATLIDYGRQDSGQYYLVMEYLDGRPLDAELARTHHFAPARAVRIAAQLCRAMGAVHEQGIVHRDLKPSNVFLTRVDGQSDFVKLIDFGVAQHEVTSGLERITRAGTACGTPQYMSPEQIEGAPVDLRADLYALGLLTYEMLEGRPPFDGESTAEVMHGHLRLPPPPMTQPVPQALRELLDRLLAKHPEDRPASAGEVLQALVESIPMSLGADSTTGGAVTGRRAMETRESAPVVGPEAGDGSVQGEGGMGEGTAADRAAGSRRARRPIWALGEQDELRSRRRSRLQRALVWVAVVLVLLALLWLALSSGSDSVGTAPPTTSLSGYGAQGGTVVWDEKVEDESGTAVDDEATAALGEPSRAPEPVWGAGDGDGRESAPTKPKPDAPDGGAPRADGGSPGGGAEDGRRPGEPSARPPREPAPQPRTEPAPQPRAAPAPPTEPAPRPRTEPAPQPRTEPAPPAEPRPRPRREDRERDDDAREDRERDRAEREREEREREGRGRGRGRRGGRDR